MSTEIPIDHRIWIGSSPAELGYGGLEDKTELHTYTHEDGSTQDVLVIDGRVNGEGRTILKSTSLNYRIDPLLIRQETITANKLGARIVIAELSGVSGLPLNQKGEVDFSINVAEKIRTVRQTLEEASQALQGKLDLLARKQLIAMIDILGLSEFEAVEFHGYSLGAMLAATMGRVAANQQLSIPLTIDRIHLDDPFNISNLSARRFVSLAKNLPTETNRRNNIYLPENTVIGHDDITAFEMQSDATAKVDRYVKNHQRDAVFNTGQALRMGIGDIIRDVISKGLGNGTLSRESVISFARYSDSLLTDKKEVVNLSEQIISSGVATFLIH